MIDICPSLLVYEEMLAAGIQTSANTYSVMIRALCKRDIEVQKTIAMLKRQSERAGGFVVVSNRKQQQQQDDLVQLQQEGNAKKALLLFDKALAQGCIHELQMDAFNQLLRVLSHHGDTTGAMHVYDQMDTMPKSSVTYAALINLFGRVGDIDAALVYFDQYSSSTTDTPCCHVYTALVDAYLKCGLVDKALHTVTHAIPANRVKITTIPYNAIIRHYCAHDRLLDAESLVANMAVAPDSSSYGPILSAYCQANDFNKANELYASLLRTDISKAYGNLANYALLCLRHGDPAKALDVVNDMRCASLEPDAVLSEQIIMCFLQQGLVKDATIALDKVIRVMSTRSITKATTRLTHAAVCIADAIDGKEEDDDNGWVDLLAVARALLNGTLQLPATALADRIVTRYQQEMKTSDPEIVLEAALVCTCLKDEQSFATFVLDVQQHMTSQVSQDLILRVLARLDGKNATLWKNAFDQQQQAMMNPQQASECISKQVMRAVVAGDVMEAVRIVREELVAKEIVPAPETMRDAIALAGKQGHLSSAHTMYELSMQMYQEHLDQERAQKAVYMATNSILIGHAQQGDMVQAKEYYDAIKRMGQYPDGNAYASLLLGMAHSANTTDEAADALIIYDEAKRHHVKPTTFFYNVVISKLAKARKLEPALRLFDEMQRLFKLTPNIITYGAVISACVRAGSEAHACRLFDEMLLRRRGGCQQDELRIGPFNNMIQFYVRQQPDRSRALFYFEQLKKYNIQPSAHTYKLLLEAYSTIAPFDMDAAHHLLDHVIARPQPTHYATLIYAYGTIHKDIHRAQQVFDQVVPSNQDMEVVYQAMLDTLISNDQLERAEQVYKQMSRRITNKSSSPYIENLLLRGYGQRGWIGKAEELFERMSDDKSSSPKGTVVREPSTYEAMVRAYLDNNLVPKAKCILDRMMSRQFPDRVVASVAALIHAH